MTVHARHLNKLTEKPSLKVPTKEMLALIEAIDEEFEERERRMVDRMNAAARAQE